MPADVAEILREFLVTKPAGMPIWGGPWSNAACSKMIRLDLAEARETWLKSFKDARLREEMAKSDFLAYRDSLGLVSDFHSLRHTYISRLDQSGATPKVAQ